MYDRVSDGTKSLLREFTWDLRQEKTDVRDVPGGICNKCGCVKCRCTSAVDGVVGGGAVTL